ncbi:MAG: NAD(P)H-binding protein [Gammaproteobacteria bacterium]|nr:NAD(P)H-binding protein [Gammaproteobacteria bacterium]
MTRLLVTGANGQLGRRLLTALPASVEVEAVVRSERARDRLARHAGARGGLAIHVLDPADPAALAPLAARTDAAVHLIGTIKESRTNRYVDSHQRPIEALLAAARGGTLDHVVYVGILGAAADSACACLRARAAVERALAAAPLATSVIRVPMVIGEGDRASAALARRAGARHAWLWRGASLEQPIYAGDVVAAIRARLAAPTDPHRVFDLAGPESLSRAALVARAARLAGRTPRIHSLPLAGALVLAGLLERLQARPAITRDMLRVLDHDDAIDPHPAATALGIELTALDTMLARCVVPRLVQASGR